MATSEAIRQAIALLEDVGLLKPTNDEVRRARSWEAVLDRNVPDEDLSWAVRCIARSTEKQYGAVTPKQLNSELKRCRTERVHAFLQRWDIPHPYSDDPAKDLAYQRAYLAAIGDGLPSATADIDGQAAANLFAQILRSEPDTNPQQLLARMEAASSTGERPWRAYAHNYQPTNQATRKGNAGTRTYSELVQQINGRNKE